MDKNEKIQLNVMMDRKNSNERFSRKCVKKKQKETNYEIVNWISKRQLYGKIKNYNKNTFKEN